MARAEADSRTAARRNPRVPEQGSPTTRDGLGWGTGAVSLALVVPIAALVGYLQVSRADTPAPPTPAARAA